MEGGGDESRGVGTRSETKEDGTDHRFEALAVQEPSVFRPHNFAYVQARTASAVRERVPGSTMDRLIVNGGERAYVLVRSLRRCLLGKVL